MFTYIPLDQDIKFEHGQRKTIAHNEHITMLRLYLRPRTYIILYIQYSVAITAWFTATNICRKLLMLTRKMVLCMGAFPESYSIINDNICSKLIFTTKNALI